MDINPLTIIKLSNGQMAIFNTMSSDTRIAELEQLDCCSIRINEFIDKHYPKLQYGVGDTISNAFDDYKNRLFPTKYRKSSLTRSYSGRNFLQVLYNYHFTTGAHLCNMGESSLELIKKEFEEVISNEARSTISMVEHLGEESLVFQEINIEKMLYQPMVFEKGEPVNICGEIYTNLISSPKVYVVITNDKIEQRNVSFVYEGILHELFDIIHDKKGDNTFIECRYWIATVVGYT
jgi:hypothetical protein